MAVDPHAPLPPKRRLAMLWRVIHHAFVAPGPHTAPPLVEENLPPLLGRTEIVRDARGIPHIYADHEPDLYAALGYLQGADRFVLLDILRHLGAGRLTELIGNPRMPSRSELFPGRPLVDLDAFVRPLGFEAASERDYEEIDPRGRACLDAFAAGMNAALHAMRGAYPGEHLALGPLQPWRPSDALLAARTCAFAVALGPLAIELAFDEVRGKLGEAGARRLFPDAPWENLPDSYVSVPGVEPQVPVHLPGIGSNNWAVSGARSESGKPLFANDPHVPFLPFPTFWYHAHLECPAYRVQGGLLLGCPVFAYGHNGSLAWGITTAYRDAWDLYRIHRGPGDATHYQTPDGTGRIHAHHENHTVRLGSDVPLSWESCEHGILYPGWKHHDGIDLALRYAPSRADQFFSGYLDLAGSRSVDEHRAALRRINEGPFDFNHVYAHREGEIAWEPYGRLPRRSRDGLFIRDAQDPEAQWHGFLDFEENPKQRNPVCGYVASANSFTDPEQSARGTSRVHPEPPYRFDRIVRTLAGHERHNLDTFAALQADIVAEYAPPLRDALLALVESSGRTPSPTAAEALGVLRGWDGSFAVTEAAPPVFSLWRRSLATRCFDGLLGAETSRHYRATRRDVARLQRLLLDPRDPLRSDIEQACGSTLGVLAQETLEDSVSRLQGRLGVDVRAWRWGDLQRLRVGSLYAMLPWVGRRFLAVDAPFPGDIYTVQPSIAVPNGEDLRVFTGATSRFLCDLARPEEALFAHSSGPGSEPGSPFHAVNGDIWGRFEYFRSALWKAEEVPDVVERLVINPVGS